MRSLMRRLLLIFLAVVLTGVASGLLAGCKQKKSASEPSRKSTPAEEKEDIDVEEW